MRYLHKKAIIYLLLISLGIAIIGDIFYGNIENAKLFFIGSFLFNLSELAYSLATVFLILYLMLRVIFKDYLEMLFYHHPIEPIKKRTQNKRGTKNE